MPISNSDALSFCIIGEFAGLLLGDYALYYRTLVAVFTLEFSLHHVLGPSVGVAALCPYVASAVAVYRTTEPQDLWCLTRVNRSGTIRKLGNRTAPFGVFSYAVIGARQGRTVGKTT